MSELSWRAQFQLFEIVRGSRIHVRNIAESIDLGGADGFGHGLRQQIEKKRPDPVGESGPAFIASASAVALTSAGYFRQWPRL
jgi:hypothetical protein